EVLFPWTAAFFRYHNETYGTSLALQQKTSEFFEELTGETEAQMYAKFDAFVQTGHYLRSQPLPAAADTLRRLAEQYTLLIITARRPSCRGSTERFVERHFPGVFADVQYTHDRHDPTHTTPKHELCRRAGAALLIDDSPRNISAAAAAGMQGILFGKYPWNQCATLPTGVTRCAGWQAVETHLRTERTRADRRLWQEQNQLPSSSSLAKPAAAKVLSH
ncbi:MAG TPA: hypothetical protein VHC98_03375, partial [Candidatus Saccharimonadales bacterium]|nr:hypothetical protein [Candidatus Saccharimonadales bacterium]